MHLFHCSGCKLKLVSSGCLVTKKDQRSSCDVLSTCTGARSSRFMKGSDIMSLKTLSDQNTRGTGIMDVKRENDSFIELLVTVMVQVVVEVNSQMRL